MQFLTGSYILSTTRVWISQQDTTPEPEHRQWRSSCGKSRSHRHLSCQTNHSKIFLGGAGAVSYRALVIVFAVIPHSTAFLMADRIITGSFTTFQHSAADDGT